MELNTEYSYGYIKLEDIQSVYASSLLTFEGSGLTRLLEFDATSCEIEATMDTQWRFANGSSMSPLATQVVKMTFQLEDGDTLVVNLRGKTSEECDEEDSADTAVDIETIL